MFTSCLALVLAGIQGQPQSQNKSQPDPATEYVISNEDIPETTSIRVESPLLRGRFDATTRLLDDGTRVEVHLIGMIDEHPDFQRAVSADLVFVYPIGLNDVQKTGTGRLVTHDSATSLFACERLAPGASEWMNLTHRELGTIQIWDPINPDKMLSDSVVVALFHDLVAQGQSLGTQGTDCDPTFTQCKDAAKNTCSPNRVGSVNYSCNEGAVTCSFTCLQSPPE